MSKVFPGLEEVFANVALLQSMFMSEDLPTLDLPTNANSGSFNFGVCSTEAALPANLALVISITVKFAQMYERVRI